MCVRVYVGLGVCVWVWMCVCAVVCMSNRGTPKSSKHTHLLEERAQGDGCPRAMLAFGRHFVLLNDHPWGEVCVSKSETFAGGWGTGVCSAFSCSRPRILLNCAKTLELVAFNSCHTFCLSYLVCFKCLQDELREQLSQSQIMKETKIYQEGKNKNKTQRADSKILAHLF